MTAWPPCLPHWPGWARVERSSDPTEPCGGGRSGRIGSERASSVAGENTAQRYALPLTAPGTLHGFSFIQEEFRILTLLDGAELFGKVLIGRRGGHLFERGLPAGEVFEPLINLLSY